jgi:hypothetical protein
MITVLWGWSVVCLLAVLADYGVIDAGNGRNYSPASFLIFTEAKNFLVRI